MNDLLEMLSFRRPDGSKTERAWIKQFIEPLGVQRDKAGNLIKRVGTAEILWSAHTDTVHRVGGRQNVRYLDGVASIADKQSNCLGADNTAGVWLLREMIRAGVPGLYVFHRGEECGGHGSSHIAFRTPELADGLKAAIAFDRRGTKSIITHQMRGRTCSDAFALSIASALNLGHMPDDGGTFTDTANYEGIIGECSNVSVGFNREHHDDETLDVEYLLRLREALLGMNLAALRFERQPGEIEPREVIMRGWGELETDWDQPRTLEGVMRDYPTEFAEYLEDEYGLTAADVMQAFDKRLLDFKRFK